MHIPEYQSLFPTPRENPILWSNLEKQIYQIEHHPKVKRVSMISCLKQEEDAHQYDFLIQTTSQTSMVVVAEYFKRLEFIQTRIFIPITPLLDEQSARFTQKLTSSFLSMQQEWPSDIHLNTQRSYDTPYPLCLLGVISFEVDTLKKTTALGQRVYSAVDQQKNLIASWQNWVDKPKFKLLGREFPLI
jgi:hypothetical protein